MTTTGARLVEQRARWASGRPALVEALLGERPALSTDEVLDLIYNEIVLREERGEQPSFAEYAARFPAFAAELRLQFEVHEALGSGRPAAAGAELPAVPGYELLEILGRGGMGLVYAANQASLGRRVAIKVLPPEASDDREALARFQAEARTASSLDHPNVAMIFDFGNHDGRPFIVMELVVGRTLAALIRERRPAADALVTLVRERRPAADGAALVTLVRQAAQALAAAHAAGIVHRDVKPANIMVRDDGFVKVLDFGLARLAPRAGGGGGGDASGIIAGTPRYMSPEQARGDATDGASDVFSLGLVLHELVTGRHPLEPDPTAATLTSAAAALPAAPPVTGPGLDPDVDALLRRMLAREPGARPTMAEVARALSTESPPPAPIARGPARRRRRLAWSLAGALVAAAAVAVPLVLWSRARHAAAPARATPSIVVMPFTTVGDPAGAYFSAGVTEDITSMLTRAPDLAVRSYGAALAYQGRQVDARDVGRELGVDYVLEGAVRKDAQQVRITARLVDARTGLDVWAERLDQTGADPWALQDAIAGRIVGALTGEYGQVKRAQYHAAWGADRKGLHEYDVYLRGHELYMRLTADDNDLARDVWRRGLVTFPGSALLETKLGFAHFMRPFLFFRAGADADYARAGALVRSALARPHRTPLENRLAHWLFAYVSCQEGDFDRALREMATTIALAPYDLFALGDLSTIALLAGRPDEALRMLDQALASDPAARPFYQQLRGWALAVAGRHQESLTALAEGLQLPMVPLLQAVDHAELGRADLARRLVAQATAAHPELTLAAWRSANFYRDGAILDRQLALLAAAGLR